MKKIEFQPIINLVDIRDDLRKPINSESRKKRIEGKECSELYPYYGATGQVGFIDDYLIEGEYVLVGEDGAPFLEPLKHKAYIVKGRGWVNNHAHILKAISGQACNKFIKYYLNYFRYDDYVNGTTRLKLTRSMLEQIPVPVFDLKDQRIIVGKIDSIFADIDAGLEKINELKVQLESYKQSVLHAAFSGVLNDLPKGWVLKKLSEVSQYVQRGKSPKYAIKSDFVVINQKCIRWYCLDLAFAKYVFEDQIHLYSNDRFLRKGDLLWNSTGTGTIGRACLFNSAEGSKSYVVDSHVTVIRVCEDLLPEYLLNYLASPFIQKNFENFQTGSTNQIELSREKILDIVVPIAPIQQQQRLVQEINFVIKEEQNTLTQLSMFEKQLNLLKQAILKQAFEGGLV